MKWLALALIISNIGVWQLSGSVREGAQSVTVARGNLPRVASLKFQDPPAESLQSEPGGRSCVTLGWIRSLESARALVRHQALVQSSGLSVKEVERPLPPLHWVIIPPQPHDMALEQFRDIQRQGVDSYLVTEGENKNAISLGLFESYNAAIFVLEEKKRQNLNVVLVNFPRNQISYALSFETESDLAQEMIQAVEADYGEEFDFIDVNPCGGVATPGKTP
ncbi:MAG TPA: hypothetical protein VL091_03365 [Marinobacter sp.]|nr:hypothetical protein [Marinobacter sp.]